MLKSPLGLWSILNQLQLIILIFTVDQFYPSDIIDFLNYIGYSLLNFYFIPFEKITGVDDFLNWVDEPQSWRMLRAAQLPSKSAFVNNFSLFPIIGVIILIHILFALIPPYKERVNTEMPKYSWSWLRIKLVNEFNYFTVYIRFMLEVMVTLLLCSCSEIYNFNNLPKTNSFSIVFAYMFICACFIMLALFAISYYKLYTYYDKYEKTVFMEFYRGINNTTISRLYHLIFIIRRMLFIILVVFMSSVDRIVIFSLMIGK